VKVLPSNCSATNFQLTRFQNAFVLAQSLRREHHLPVAALCVVCDALLVAAGVFGLATVLAQSPVLLAVARWGGAAFLIWYGACALRRACSKQSLDQGDTLKVRSLRAVLLSALAVTLLNPHVYLDTVLLIGSLGAQQTEPGAYVAGAASASFLWFTTLALGAAVGGHPGKLCAHQRRSGGAPAGYFRQGRGQ
jgi:L-lysine exporter family protein LysE/ArgO